MVWLLNGVDVWCFLPVPPVPRGRVHAKAEHKEEIVYADISELALLVHDSVHGGASDRYAGVL